MCDCERYSSRSIFLIHFDFQCAQFIEACLKRLLIVVAHSVGERGGRNIALHIGQMKKSFSALSVSGRLLRGEMRLDLACDNRCVDHNVFGFARMDIDTLDGKLGIRSIKIIVGHLPLVIAVQRVGELGLKIV